MPRFGLYESNLHNLIGISAAYAEYVVLFFIIYNQYYHIISYNLYVKPSFKHCLFQDNDNLNLAPHSNNFTVFGQSF